MCRSIKTLPSPAKVNATAFDQAVDTIAASTRELLQELKIHPVRHR